MKKKLLVILGAGSSISCGMPAVSDLDDQMRAWSEAWAIRRFPNYFMTLREAIETYHRGGRSGLRPPLNFEKILGEMIALSHWMTPAPWGDTLRQTACDNAAPPHLSFLYPDNYGPAVTVRDQFSHLSIELTKYMRGLCRALDPDAVLVRQYRTLIDGLRETFDVGIYNLNYDTVALTAWPTAYAGFDTKGAFDPAGVHGRR